MASIKDSAFADCNKLADVYFEGDSVKWRKIVLYDGNSCLVNAVIHYNQVEPSPDLPGKYTVSYDLNGGNNGPSSQSYTAGATVIIPSTAPVRDGYTFTGWSDGNQTYQAGQAFTMPEMDVTLTAQWKQASSSDPILNNDTIFIKQISNKTCTLVTATMMVRRRAILDGISDWDSITEAAMKKVAWGNNGFIEGFTYQGITGGTESIRDKSTKEKKEYLISLLRQHPEGIGVYSWMSRSQRHAVLLTDYDAATDTFYCADPSRTARHGRIPLDQCSITWGGEGQAGVLGVLHRIYYVAKDVNRKTLVSSQINSHCPVDMVLSINGTTLDSRIITGTSTNSFASMTVTGADDGKSIEVQIIGDYLNNYDADVKLIGTDTGEMTFIVEHLYSDGSIERNIFKHVPVSMTFTAETAGCYPQSSVVLSISDSAEKMFGWQTQMKLQPSPIQISII